MSVVYGIQLLTKGETKRIKLKDAKDKVPLTMESLQTIIKKKTPLVELGSYVYNQYTLTLFGYTTGKAGTENKHELPPPLDNKLFFSDILLIASEKNKSWKEPIGITSEQYQDFYNKAFGGFEDIEDDDDDEEEESEEEESESEEDDDEDFEDEELAQKNPELAKLNKLVKGKKASVEDEEEDGSKEDDEESTEEDSEEFEEEGDGDDVEEEPDVESDDDASVEEKTPVKKTSKKKSSRYTSILSQFNSKSRQSQFMKLGFEEITAPLLLHASAGQEKLLRTHLSSKLQSIFSKQFTSEQLIELESVILRTALREAEVKKIIKHFDNPVFRDCYMVCARRIISNINPKSYVKNENLLPRLLSGDLTMEHLASMNVMDFAPGLYAGLREQMLLREKQQLEGNKAMATDMFKCGRCHKRECTYYELQTRSADEPMTKFITCLNCGAHWRQ